MIEWTRNPALEEELLARLRMKFIHNRTNEIHFSDAMSCLTKAYWEKTDPLPVDRLTLGLFAIGFALEDVLLKPYPITGESMVPSYQYEDVHFSPDYFASYIGGEMDLKTTRMWEEKGGDGRPKRIEGGDNPRPHGFPNTWMKQFMGYAHRFGANPPDDQCPVAYVDYNVAILYVMTGELVAGTIRYDWEEVELNMLHHLHRAAILEDQLDKGVPPIPFMYNEPWECGVKGKYCRYLSRCRATEG